MRIVLIGFMGSGKSSVARCLARSESIPLAEMDELICRRSGSSSVAEIFNRFGVEYFRNLEREVALELSQRQDVVVSCGGGVVEYPQTMAALLAPPACCIYLKTSFSAILERLQNPSSRDARPLFSSEQQARELYDTRQALYQHYADITVTTDDREVESICKEIHAQLESSVID